MMIRTLALFTFVGLWVSASAQKERDLLTDFYSRKLVSESIGYDNQWIHYPAYSDREGWSQVPEEVRRKTIDEGEAYLDYDWPTITATMYLEFTRTGDRSAVDRPSAERSRALRTLAMAELMEGEGRFLDDLINGVFVLCEQTYWGSSAHFYLYGFEGSPANPTTVVPDIDDPIIDLRVGYTAADLAWIWHFFHDEFDKVSPIIAQRLKDEITRKVLKPYYERYDFWWITGWGEGRVNNWNPWCNYNLLTCILLLEDDPEKKVDAVYKSMASVDLFINSYPDDGGCSEGPSYWAHAGGKLFDYLSLLKASTQGNIDLFDHELIKNMGRYIYRVYIGNGNYYINFADAPLKLDHEPGRIYRYGRAIADDAMQSFGTFLLRDQGYGTEAETGVLGESLANLFSMEGWKDVAPSEPLVGEFYFPDLDVAIAREQAGSTLGFYYAAKGGSNGEHHNHNDVGSFMLYFNHHPVLIDVGVGTYTRETFSENRYKIWTMQSDYHNVPLINGHSQLPGGEYRAQGSDFSHSEQEVSYSTNIAGAYPEEAAVQQWVRSYRLERSQRFIIEDQFQLTAVNDSTRLHLMAGVPCRTVEEGLVEFTAADFTLQMKYDPTQLALNIEPIAITDPRLLASLGEQISRLVFTLREPAATGQITLEVTEKQ